jgi:hypothetical protein
MSAVAVVMSPMHLFWDLDGPLVAYLDDALLVFLAFLLVEVSASFSLEVFRNMDVVIACFATLWICNCHRFGMAYKEALNQLMRVDRCPITQVRPVFQPKHIAVWVAFMWTDYHPSA